MSSFENIKNYIDANPTLKGYFSRNAPTEYNMPEQLNKLPTGGPFINKPGHDRIVEFLAGPSGLQSFKNSKAYADVMDDNHQDVGKTPPVQTEQDDAEFYDLIQEMVVTYFEQVYLKEGNPSPQDLFVAKLITEDKTFVERVFEVLETHVLGESFLDSTINSAQTQPQGGFNTVPKAGGNSMVRNQYLKATEQAVDQKYDAAKKQAQSKYNTDLAKINEKEKRDRSANIQSVAKKPIK